MPQIIDNMLLSNRLIKSLLDEFACDVQEKKYNRIPYTDYKDLIFHVKYDEDADVKICYDDSHKIMIMTVDNYIYSTSSDDKSFGSFLFKRIFANRYPMKTNNNKENNTMKFNFDFGPVDSNIRMSPYGMAIKNAEGTYVSYNVSNSQIIDVDVFNFDGSNFMFKMPVALKDVKAGDIIVHQHKPMFVTGLNNNALEVIDIYCGEAKGIVPTTNMFGFNFVTKVISFLDMSTPTQDNPFGNMWPLFMMNDNKTDKNQMLMMMFMMSQSKGAPNTLFQNPLFMMAFMQDNNMTPLLMGMMMTQNQGCTCGGQCGKE